jgi:hypothetical protein
LRHDGYFPSHNSDTSFLHLRLRSVLSDHAVPDQMAQLSRYKISFRECVNGSSVIDRYRVSVFLSKSAFCDDVAAMSLTTVPRGFYQPSNE